jgi:hypothetical protein
MGREMVVGKIQVTAAVERVVNVYIACCMGLSEKKPVDLCLLRRT